MTKQEFERRMERARKGLVEHNGQIAVCNAMASYVCWGARCDFEDNFRPMFASGWWLDDIRPRNKNDNMTQLERRLVFLESFKGFCEAYELYESW